MSGQFALLRSRRFLPLFVTQFLGAFNDNLYKNALVVLLTFQTAQWTTLAPALLANLAAGLFILPFVLFSATAGQWADKYDKARLARASRLLEILLMGIAAFGFWWHSLALLMLALFLLGVLSTVFGPIKYALLPQHLHPEELVGGNALIEAGTFLAILLGTLAGGLLAGMGAAPAWIAGASLVVAVAGYLASREIPAAPPPVPELAVNPNPLRETWRGIAFVRRAPRVFLAILAISWFWLYGALFLAQCPAYARMVLGGNEAAVTVLLALFSVGIGLGSLACERLSGKRLELRLVPVAALGLSVFALDLAWGGPAPAGEIGRALPEWLAAPGMGRVLFDVLMLGVCGGVFIVPLYALLQLESDVEHRARVIAANNIVNALFMVAGALGAAALLGAGVSIPALFGIAAGLNVLVAAVLCRRDPAFWPRRHDGGPGGRC